MDDESFLALGCVQEHHGGFHPCSSIAWTEGKS